MQSLVGKHFEGTPKEASKQLNLIACKHNFAVAVKRSSKEHKIDIICTHGGEHRNTHDINDETRKRHGYSNKTGCGWKMYLKWDKTSCDWVVKTVSDENDHNHVLKDPSYYHQHRKPTQNVQQQILSMTASSIKPSKIYEEILASDDGTMMTMQDLYNFRHKILEQDRHGGLSRLFEFLINNNFITRYKLGRDHKMVEAVFFTHHYGCNMAQDFPEIIIIDATYKTNSSKLPLVNVLCVSNLGRANLKNALVASAFLTNEKKASYTWLAQTLRRVIWPTGRVGIFITDNDAALVNSIEEIFPESKHILCGWHIYQHLRTNLCNCFLDSDQLEDIGKVLKSMIYKARDEKSFNDAVDRYRSWIGKAAISYAKQNFKDNTKDMKEKADTREAVNDTKDMEEESGMKDPENDDEEEETLDLTLENSNVSQDQPSQNPLDIGDKLLYTQIRDPASNPTAEETALAQKKKESMMSYLNK